MFSQDNEEKKLDWMYKGAGSTVDREEYLLGRSIDKSLEQLNATETQNKLSSVTPKNHVEHECIPPSIRDFKKMQSGEQVDLQQKLQEDPLVAIKKQEEETRQRLLQNPVQLKKLQRILKQKSAKKKSKKKRKKQSESDSDSSKRKTKKKRKKSNDFELDQILTEKFMRLKHLLKKSDLDEILNMESGSSNDDDDRKQKSKKSKHKSKEKMHTKDNSKRRNKSTDSEEDRKNKSVNDKKSSHHNERSGKQTIKHSVKNKRKSSSTSDESDEDVDKRNYHGHKDSKIKTNQLKINTASYSDSDEDRYKRKNQNYGLVKADGSKIHQHRDRDPHSVQTKQSKTNNDVKTSSDKSSHKRKILTEEEMNQRRKEMMQNAEWRDTERVKNVKRYREEDKKEKGTQEYNPGFLQKELLKSANSSTVESRIKANINNIQRSSRDMSTHFSRRH